MSELEAFRAWWKSIKIDGTLSAFNIARAAWLAALAHKGPK